MAGGMKRRSGLNVAEKMVGWAASSATELEKSRRPAEARGWHCVVHDPVDGGDGVPGLVIEWRAEPGGVSEAHVVYLAESRRGWVQVQEWLPAAVVRVL